MPRERASGRRLEGYAATFGVEAEIGDFTETIRAGAFTTSLAANKDILALGRPRPGRVLARTRSKTLRLSEDSRGLAFDLDLPNTTFANDALALIERGDLGGMSFAFIAIDERWTATGASCAVSISKRSASCPHGPRIQSTQVQARSRPVSFPRVAVARRYLETM